MKIYELGYDANNYLGCYLKNGRLTREQMYEFSDAAKLGFRPDFTAEYDRESKLPIGDLIYCWGPGFPRVISEKAKTVFESSFDDSSFEIFPIQDEYGKSLYVFNNLVCLDALDPEKTEYAYFKGIKARVKKHVFKTDLPYPPLFQILLTGTHVLPDHYVTDGFVSLIEEADLKGFAFTQVWDSGE